MISKLLFSDRAPKVIRKSVDFNADKAAMHGSNIANAETPGYKARKMEFKSVLREVTNAGGLQMTTTNGKHISHGASSISSINPSVTIDNSTGRIDGNNVVMETEMSNLAEAKIGYDAGITAMMKRGAIVKSAITDAR